MNEEIEMYDKNGELLQIGDKVYMAIIEYGDTPSMVIGVVEKINLRKARRTEPKPCIHVRVNGVSRGLKYTWSPQDRIVKI